MWQVLAYIFRSISIHQVTQIGTYVPYFVLMLLAPILTNAYVYMVIGRMAYNFTNDAKIFGIKAWRLTLAFVCLDFIAFVVQCSGATMASGDNLTDAQIKGGLHIYMGGIGLQQFVILLFFGVFFKFRQQMIRDLPPSARKAPMTLIYVIFVVLILISVRIIFRLIEYANGYKSSIVIHEAYQYTFDSTVMWFALVLFNIFHPGKIMPGKESDFPSRKERKAAGKDFKWGRAANFGGRTPNSEMSLEAQRLQGEPKALDALHAQEV